VTRVQRNGLIWLAAMLAILLALAVDQPIARAMAGMDPAVLRIAGFVTWFGQGGVTLYPTGVLILFGLAGCYLLPGLAERLVGPIRKLAAIFITVAAAGLADDALKVVFGRARPYVWLAGDDSGFGFFRYGAKFASFPSGHTTTSMAAALAFGVVFPRWRPAFLLAALLIALSRIVLDVHYLSDVIAGALLGGAVAFWLLQHFKKRGWLPSKMPQDSDHYGVVEKGAKKTGGKRNSNRL
jgi:membrane-associated phospholipid phosphatase